MRKLSLNKANREHLLRNLATSLVLFEQIDTTAPRAKEVKSLVDRTLARSKVKNLSTIRSLNKLFFDRNAVKKITDELIPRYKNRTSGFIRSYHLNNRLGDNAPMMRLELVDKKIYINSSNVAKDMSAKNQAKETNDNINRTTPNESK